MRFNQVILPGAWQDVAPLFYGFEACRPGHTYGPAVRSCYLFHYVMEGKGTFFREDGVYAVEKGDIFLIRPGEVTTYKADAETPWKYVWLAFESSQPLAFLQEAVWHQMPVKHLFGFIHEHMDEDGLEGKIYAVTHELLWILSRSAQKGQRGGSRYAEYLKVYIENAYMHSVRMHEIADRLHIDRRYLTALFRERYGQSPQSYLMDYRLSKADVFLQSGYSVTEAASMAGFSDLSNFSRRYKQKFGISPSRIR